MKIFKKNITLLLTKLEILSALAIRLTRITGKSKIPVHPKHLVNLDKPWYLRYIKSEDEVLDVGCGVGNTAVNVAKKAKFVIGFDKISKNLTYAKKFVKEQNLDNVRFIKADADKKLPFKNNRFTKVIMFDVLEHLKNRNQAIREVKRVLKKKGLFLLLTDNPDTSWKRAKREAGLFYYADRDHKYEYSREEIIWLLERNDFKVLSVKLSTYDTPLKPVIDLIGSLTLSGYRKLSKKREAMVYKNPQETTGYKIVSLNKK
ncbi:hypothetical protein A3G14_05455 [Candidatus Curtissbacteria bacterium RIFCSPLOWO2_12_FULL_38_9]|uniref:Methyltransferase domain-containing protein n=1 Tax=Candidatus Curtissbacteria bacterium RIFCSPLOWO2_12_FULL_38_9 TaxID=1797735 RepID=A0A1F5IAK1_9BACT|nr:MAG: hypothetical protein A2775_00180 [Candidatus Curtissbacteria bacterium RIFCSPHIGHO2_01_FULL_39_57]OGD90068.1 MAG: hypothetical protein A3E11_01385 [Candidatus Curtissbacteria bacterium RIFCSPHIGHO2_12_FULL_38_37]OGE13299.1 MAG: hypothetical protein A3G14_05455 [Candidatus Curtissbacteria bacterium RIFCSPLOWO2_12_FULL_38_9]